MSIKGELSLNLKQILEQMGVSDVTVAIDYPADPKHGDYSSNIALIAAKKLNRNPLELAEELRLKIKDLGLIEKVEVVKPGFINFWLKQETMAKKLQEIAGKNAEKVLEDIYKGRKVIIEYSSPNIAKPFTIGHLRSTIIGDAIANLLEAVGWQVYRDNHVGDWGTQFGKQICAIKHWGNEAEIDQSDRPVKMLVDLYMKFYHEAETSLQLDDEAREWFKKLEDGDPEARRIWKKCIDWSWKEFEDIYKKLGVPSGKDAVFENNGRGYGEAFFEDKMGPVIAELEEKKLLEQGEEGAKLVFFTNDEYTPLMILKKDGATLYSTRDLATDKFRLEYYGSDIRIINEVGAEQALYFKQLYKLEEMLGWYKKDQRIHKKHGFYRFKEGRMSTRKGNVIWLEDVLEEAIVRAEKLSTDENAKEVQDVKKIGNQVAIGAIKWNDLKRSSEQDILYDWDEILNMQGNSGPYIQYTFARTQSVLAKAGEWSPVLSYASLAPEERELLKLLSRFAEIVSDAAERLSPNILCIYLFEVAQAFNLFYQKCPILKSETELKQFRLFLTKSTGEILKKGLALLGIAAPEKM